MNASSAQPLARSAQPACCHLQVAAKPVRAWGQSAQVVGQTTAIKDFVQRVQARRQQHSSLTACSTARADRPQAGVQQPEVCYEDEIARLQLLAHKLAHACSAVEKVKLLRADARVSTFLSQVSIAARLLEEMECLTDRQQYSLLTLPAMRQEHILQVLPEGNGALRPALEHLADTLLRADTFYSSLNGLLGYQAKCLQLIQQNRSGAADSPCAANVELHMPEGPDLAGPWGRELAAQVAAVGLEALPQMAEIWPLGGAGDRLGLTCESSGRCMPTAMLPYCGRTLLEGLVRDLEAREYLYFRLYGVQKTTPIVIMTSDAKDNHHMVLGILQSFNWFGRGKENFRVIRQPLVPVVSAVSGEWVLPQPLKPMLKPGGHGAIWKLMLDEGAFQWLRSLDRQAALVRQISNPLAGTDATLLALSGAGYADGRSFGFASCERTVGAAEGMNVLMQRRLPRSNGSGFEYAYNVTNVEYTEFDRLGISEEPRDGGQMSCFPANTNVLYIGLQAAEGAVKAGVTAGGGAALPGMVFNSKKTVTWTDALSGRTRCEPAGRLECTMQNLVDSMAQRFQEPVPKERHAELNTFVVFNKRRRVTSSAKRKRVPGSTIISQTPDGSFLDLMRNAADLLHRCGFRIPQVFGVEEYLEKGPSFIFLYHPALGPLWDVISQKIRGGAMTPGSELVLEVGEAAIADLRLDGSLLVHAECVYGRPGAALGEECSAPRLPGRLSGQTVTYPDSGSEAVQFSEVLPALEETSGTVVPLPRKMSVPAGAAGEVSAKGGADVRSRPAPSFKAKSGRIDFSSQCARVRLTGVIVHNKGIDWQDSSNVYWQHKVARHEQVKVVLHGQSEFEASHVVLLGSHTFEVPDGYKMVVSAAPGGGLRRALYPLTGRRPSWQWRHLSGERGAIRLRMEDPTSHLPGVPLTSRPTADQPFTYMI